MTAEWLDLPRLAYPEVKAEWVVGYYDGYLSGVADCHGLFVWFELAVPEYYHHRYYTLHELTDAEHTAVCAHHLAWNEAMGPTWDVTYVNGLPRVLRQKQKENWREAYDALPKYPILSTVPTTPAFALTEFYPTPHMKRARSVKYWRKIYEESN